MPHKRLPKYDQIIPVQWIKVPKGRRTAGINSVLEASIKNRGLLFPIIVTPDYILIIGARRLDVCKKLGWATMPVKIMRADDHDRKLIDLEENLSHEALHYLEEIKQLKQYKELYVAKYPDSRRGNNRKKHEVERNGGVSHTTFTKVIAKKLGVSHRKIEKDIKLAGEISDDAAKKIWNKRIANKPNELKRLAKHDFETQVELATEIEKERTNDLRGAELNLKLNSSDAHSLAEFNSKAKAFQFELDKANQQSLFRHAVDRSDPNLWITVELFRNIIERTTNSLEYYERNKPRLLDAA